MCGVHCSAHLSFCREVPEEEVEEKEKEVVVPGTGRLYGPNDYYLHVSQTLCRSTAGKVRVRNSSCTSKKTC